jgi:hypothetical protein
VEVREMLSSSAGTDVPRLEIKVGNKKKKEKETGLEMFRDVLEDSC